MLRELAALLQAAEPMLCYTVDLRVVRTFSCLELTPDLPLPRVCVYFIIFYEDVLHPAHLSLFLLENYSKRRLMFLKHFN